MANEYKILTENQAGDSWVDNVPGEQVTTGYQAQNTNIKERTNGMDLSSVRAQGSNVVIEISGPIDVNGLPFVGTQEIVLTPPSQGNYYIEIINGSSLTQKSVQLTTNAPTWDSTKNGFYRSGNKYLNYFISYIKGDINIYKINPAGVSLGSSSESVNFPYGFVRGFDLYDRFWYINRNAQFQARGNRGYAINYEANKTYSINAASNEVYIEEGFTSTILVTISVPADASGVTYIPNRNEILVCFDSLTDSTIRRYDGDTGASKGSFTADLRSVDLTYDEQDDIIYISGGLGVAARTTKVRGSDFLVVGYIGTATVLGGGLIFDFIKRRLLYSGGGFLRAIDLVTEDTEVLITGFANIYIEMLKTNGNLIDTGSGTRTPYGI